MTGRDWIIYILENGLEDEPFYESGKLLGFMTDVEAAIKFGVGVSTIRVWVELGHLKGIKLGDELHIPANAESPLRKGDTNVKENNLPVVTVFNNGHT